MCITIGIRSKLILTGNIISKTAMILAIQFSGYFFKEKSVFRPAGNCLCTSILNMHIKVIISITLSL